MNEIAVAMQDEPAWARFVEGSVLAGTQGTVRIAALLRLVSVHNSTGMKLNEIAAQAGLEQSTAHRVVTALHGVGFLSRDPNTRRFHLGPLLFELFTVAFPHFNMRDLCLPAIERLVSTLGDTVYLTVRSGFDGICIERREGGYPIRTCTLEVGQRRPLGLGASGLVLLASLSDMEIATVVQRNLPHFTCFGVDETEIYRRVERARMQDYIDQSALASADVFGVSMAIRGRTGHPFGALSVTAVASRMTPERVTQVVDALRSAVSETEQEITKLGYV